MSLTVRGSFDSGFKPVPPGMFLARCYKIIDLGTQKTSYKGLEKMQKKVTLQFEVHGEDEEGNAVVTAKGEPMSISKTYTQSLDEKSNLTKDLQSWRGKAFTSEELRGFELKNVLGVWGMISVAKSTGNDGKEYTNIMTINPVPSAIRKAGFPEGHNPLESFDIDEPDMTVFNNLTDSFKKKIEVALEWKAERKAVLTIDDLDSDIPF